MQSGLLEFTSYKIPVGKMAITNKDTSFFVGNCVSILDFEASRQATHPQAKGLSNRITPTKFQHQEKEDQRSKDWSNYKSQC